MIELKYFILGIVFVLFVSPIVESLCTLILTGIEVIKGYLTLKITKINVQIHKMSLEEDEKIIHNPIGFVCPTKEEEDNDI